jgi:hypothetical protein
MFLYPFSSTGAGVYKAPFTAGRIYMRYLNREIFGDSLIPVLTRNANQFFSKPFKKSILIFLAYLKCSCVQNQKFAPEQKLHELKKFSQ